MVQDTLQPAPVKRARTPRVIGNRSIIAALCFTSFLGTLNNSALNPFLPEVAADLNSSVPLLGQIVTVMFVLSALIGLVAGPVADHFGHRRLLLIGMTALIANGIGTALAPTFGILFVVRLSGGFAGAILAGVTLAIAGSRFTGDARRRAVSWTAASMASAPIVGVPLLTLIGGGYGWRWSFAMLTVVALLGMLLVSRALPHDGPLPVERFQAASVLTAYRPILKHHQTLGLVTSAWLRNLSWTGVFTYTGAFFIDERGLSTGAVGFVYAAGGAGFCLGSLIGGSRMARFHPVRTVVLTTALSGCLFGMVFALPSGVVLPVASLALGGFIGSFGWVAATVLLSNTSPGGSATTMVLNGAALNLGSASGGAIGGLVLATSGYTLAGLILPLFAIIGALVVWLSSPKPGPSG